MNSVRPTVVFWLLLTVIVIWQFAGIEIEKTISLGEALGLVATALLALISGGLLLAKALQQKFPFKMTFSYQHPDDTTRKTLQPSFIALTSIDRLYLKIDTKIGMEISKFDLRFVKGPRLFVKNIDPDIAKIVSVSAYNWQQEADLERDMVGPNAPSETPDSTGGVTIRIPRAKNWPVGDPLWLIVDVKVTAPWKGFVSFRGFGNHRATTRGRICFRENW